jgi:hypothetical protein
MTAVAPTGHGSLAPFSVGKIGRVTMSSALGLALAMVSYRVILDVGYLQLVAGPYDYQGFDRTPTLRGVLLSWLFLLLLLPLILRVFRSNVISAQITSVLVLISIIPTSTLVAFNPRYTTLYTLLIFVYWLLFLAACVWMPAIVAFRRPLRSHVPHLIALAVFSATILFMSWRFTGFRLHFGLFDIYELRAEARGYDVPTILGYVATIADNVLPILLAYYLRRRWLLIAAVVAVVIFYNFGISATKQVLFLLIFAIGSVAIRESSNLSRMIFWALVFVVGVAILERLMIGTLFVGSLAVHRLFFIPAHLHWVHYDFFQTNQFLYLTQSALRFFFESPYRENVQFLLGEYFIGEIAARANNGLFSDGYMNFGSVSVLFYPILCVALLKLVDGAAAGLSKGVQFVIILALTFVFQGVPIPTALLTSGVAFLLILLPTLPRPRRPDAVAQPA